jgi:hypothetical protein
MKFLKMFTDKDPAEKRWVNLAYILIAGSMACGLASVVFYVKNESQQSQDREKARVEQQADARYAACVNFNIEQLGDRASALNVTLVLFGLAESGELTLGDREAIVATLSPELQERYRQVENQAALDNPFRDCSPGAIVDFYTNPELDPGVLTTVIPTTTEAP